MPTAVEYILNNASVSSAEAFSSVSQGIQTAQTAGVKPAELQNDLDTFQAISSDPFNGPVQQTEITPLSYLQSFDKTALNFFGGVPAQDVLVSLNDQQLDVGKSLDQFATSLQQGEEYSHELFPDAGQTQASEAQAKSTLQTLLANLASMRHEMLKSVAQNLRG